MPRRNSLSILIQAVRCFGTNQTSDLDRQYQNRIESLTIVLVTSVQLHDQGSGSFSFWLRRTKQYLPSRNSPQRLFNKLVHEHLITCPYLYICALHYLHHAFSGCSLTWHSPYARNDHQTPLIFIAFQLSPSAPLQIITRHQPTIPDSSSPLTDLSLPPPIILQPQYRKNIALRETQLLGNSCCV